MSPFVLLPTRKASYSSVVLEDTPYAYYQLNETAGVTVVDSSGNSRDAVYVNTPNLNAASLISEVGGTGMGVVPAAHPNMQGVNRGAAFVWTADFTIEAWIRIDPAVSGSTNMTVAEQYPPGGNGGFLFFVQQDAGPSNRRLTLDIKKNVGVDRTRGSTNLIPGVTYHVVGKVNYPTVTLWINGVQETYVQQDTILFSLTGSQYLGLR